MFEVFTEKMRLAFFELMESPDAEIAERNTSLVEPTNALEQCIREVVEAMNIENDPNRRQELLTMHKGFQAMRHVIEQNQRIGSRVEKAMLLNQ